MFNLSFPDLDALDKKMIKLFPRKVVRKSYATTISEFKKLPNYVIEFQINKYADQNGFIQPDALKKIQSDFNVHIPEKKESEKYKSMAVELGSIEIMDHFKVFVDLNRGRYYTHVQNLNEKATVNRDILKPTRYQTLLKGGLWGKAKFQYVKSGDGAALNLSEFEPLQSSGVILKKFVKTREKFTTDEWIDTLIRSIGYTPENLSRKQKFLYLCRLIPLVEANTNLMELGPPQTGKSYFYENISEYTRIILAGDITPAKLIYNQSSKENGCLFNNDLICFDEMNKCVRRFFPIIPKLHQVMASNRIERGDMEAITDVSLVFQGNVFGYDLKDGKRIPKNVNYLEVLPEDMRTTAFFDRIYIFIHGWELPTLSDDLLNQHLGLISNYFSQVLHKLRKEDVSYLIDENIEFYSLDNEKKRKGISIRDGKALFHTISGLIKLVFPDYKLNDRDWTEITDLAIELRTNILEEIQKIDTTAIKTLKYTLRSQMKKPKPQEKVIDDKTIDKIEDEKAEKVKQDKIAPYIFERSKVFINNNNYLIKPVSYWVVKILVDEDHHELHNNAFRLKSKEIEHLDIQIANGEPIKMVNDPSIATYNYSDEEEHLNKIKNELNNLEKEIDQYNKHFNKLQQFKIKLMDYLDEKNILKIFEDLESIEQGLIIDSIIPIRQINREIEDEKGLILKGAALEPDLLSNNYNKIIKKSYVYLNQLESITKNWNEISDSFHNQTISIFKESEKIIADKEKAKIKHDKIFQGQKFPLFAFDINNLAISLKKKYHHNYLRRASPMEKIISKYLAKKPYLAHFFASKHLEAFKNDLPPNKYVKWYIEYMFKDYHTRQFVDVDTTLTAIVYHSIEKYHDQISHFYLGSGDKDLHILIDQANKYDIPNTVIVIEERNLSYELKESAENVDFLY